MWSVLLFVCASPIMSVTTEEEEVSSTLPTRYVCVCVCVCMCVFMCEFYAAYTLRVCVFVCVCVWVCVIMCEFYAAYTLRVGSSILMRVGGV